MDKFGRKNKNHKGKQTSENKSPLIPDRNEITCVESIPDVSNALRGIQEQLININKRFDKYDNVVKDVEELKCDIWSKDGLDYQIKYTAEQTEHCNAEIADLREENRYLRNEVQLLRSIMIRMDKKMEQMDADIVDLRGRSMRDNIMIHQFQYSNGEDLMKSVPEAIKHHLGVNVDFVRIHRNGPTSEKSRTPVSITGRLVNREKKEEILRAQKLKKEAKMKLPFYITAQEPIQTVEKRKRLYEISNVFRKRNISSRVQKNDIIMPNGSAYVDEVPAITNADVLQITQDQMSNFDGVYVKSTESVEKDGNVFYASGCEVHTTFDVQTVYKKVCCDPDSVSADHRILVYRLRDSQGNVSESYHDDEDYGAGRRLLRCMRDNEIMNCAFVVSRWVSKRHIGFDRFRIMEELVIDLANELDD